MLIVFLFEEAVFAHTVARPHSLLKTLREKRYFEEAQLLTLRP